ncbi:MAG: TrkA family potassium uptake protein [Oscillospiraceae bacterium]|nr:TrkA family potassium uptake protein [Oscillospiraceae bacterium]
MNILIVGCGKVGSMLASELSRMGHDVAVLDREESHFALLDSDFSGYTLSGIPIDQDVLKRAGIEGCDAILAMTEDDNVNIMICQMAKELFHTKTVLARIFDPKREKIFSTFDIRTISPTNLTVDVVLSALSGSYEARHTLIGNATLSYYTVHPQKEWIGRYLKDLNLPDTHLLGALHLNGDFTLALNDQQTLQPGDLLIAARRID